MIICVKIGEKVLIKEESRSWTTSHFTWGEGSQETDHVLRTSYFSTTIFLYVDDLNNYLQRKGQTSDLEIGFVPNINSYGWNLGVLTGMDIKSNQPYQTWPYSVINPLIPSLSKGLYVYIGEESREGSLFYKYERVELAGSIDNLVLARTIIAKTTEQEEYTY